MSSTSAPPVPLRRDQLERVVGSFLGAVDTAGFGLVVTDQEYYPPRFLYISEVGASLLGYGVDDVMSLNPLDLVEPSASTVVEEALARTREGARMLRFEIRVRTHEGRCIVLEVATNAIE